MAVTSYNYRVMSTGSDFQFWLETEEVSSEKVEIGLLQLGIHGKKHLFSLLLLHWWEWLSLETSEDFVCASSGLESRNWRTKDCLSSKDSRPKTSSSTTEHSSVSPVDSSPGSPGLTSFGFPSSSPPETRASSAEDLFMRPDSSSKSLLWPNDWNCRVGLFLCQP